MANETPTPDLIVYEPPVIELLGDWQLVTKRIPMASSFAVIASDDDGQKGFLRRWL